MESKKEIEHMPNQKWHRYISFIKSIIRISGYYVLLFNLEASITLLILSEIIGIIEEIV
jgi:hypothetical protein